MRLSTLVRTGVQTSTSWAQASRLKGFYIAPTTCRAPLSHIPVRTGSNLPAYISISVRLSRAIPPLSTVYPSHLSARLASTFSHLSPANVKQLTHPASNDTLALETSRPRPSPDPLAPDLPRRCKQPTKPFCDDLTAAVAERDALVLSPWAQPNAQPIRQSARSVCAEAWRAHATLSGQLRCLHTPSRIIPPARQYKHTCATLAQATSATAGMFPRQKPDWKE